MLYIAPPYSGKSYLAKQGRWLDGDTLIKWPGHRFWEDPDFDLDGFYLKQVIPVLERAAAQQDVAAYVPPHLLKHVSPTLSVIWLPPKSLLLRNKARDTRHKLQVLDEDKILGEYAKLSKAVTSYHTVVRDEIP